MAEGRCQKEVAPRKGSDGIEALVLQVPISEMGKIGSNQLFKGREKVMMPPTFVGLAMLKALGSFGETGDLANGRPPIKFPNRLACFHPRLSGGPTYADHIRSDQMLLPHTTYTLMHVPSRWA